MEFNASIIFVFAFLCRKVALCVDYGDFYSMGNAASIGANT